MGLKQVFLCREVVTISEGPFVGQKKVSILDLCVLHQDFVSVPLVTVLSPLLSPLKARVRTCEEVVERLGPSAVLVPSSNHPDIMAGQGTIATEFLTQACGIIQ